MKINVERVFWGVGIILLIIGLIGLYRGIKIRIDGPKIKGVVKEAFKEVIEEAPLEEIISKGVEKGNKRIVSSLNVVQKDVRIIQKEIQMMKGEVKGEKEVIVIPGPRKEKVTEKISKETVPVPMEENRIEIPLGDADYVDIAIDNGDTFTLKKVDDYKVLSLSKEKHRAVISYYKNGLKRRKQAVHTEASKENEKLEFLIVTE